MVLANYPGLVKISCDTERANFVISKLGKDVECSVRLEERNAFERLGKKMEIRTGWFSFNSWSSNRPNNNKKTHKRVY